MEYDIDAFVAQHKAVHTNYCEIIILANGQITYAEPSHLMKLQTIWGVPTDQLFDGGDMRDRLCKEMPPTASPVHWLSEVLNCVVVWYEAIIFPPNVTEQQLQSVKTLIRTGCVSNHPSIEVTMEYQLCQDENRSAHQLELICSHKTRILQQIKQILNL